MDIKQLEVFAKVFENRSFSKAAKQLGLSQPTVSTHIQHLEDSLGKKLFDRLGRRVVPTEEAKILYKHAVEILKKRDEALAELLSLDSSKVSGKVRIAASNIPGDYLIPHLLIKLKELLPEVTFQVEIYDSSKVLNLLRENIPNFDLGFVGLEVFDPKFEVKKVHNDEIVLISPPYFKRDSITLEELLKLPLIFREEDSGTRKTVEKALRKAGIPAAKLNVIAYLGSNTAIKEAVKRGAGFGLVSRYSVKDEVECKKVKVVEIRGLSIRRCFFAVKRNDITPIPAVRTIWDKLEKLFKNRNGEC
ncbi:DNA-binding transcriptional LysR family regulator [Thermovibrio guaymasensis]|uniref:DNA-binding transcriptional LysR family regulator n=1 Tax=Thermovibrio guaymasensis TaxID=240167 RepID=A0A420W6Y4_9BACT|nr:selenium metabolism-associated LysR family transcriptional regulator [Thermovibrio guaymasensis]RKQ61845.1 DNA-binding transcriptional LysR family regulator [Thermovibrio guaymasensis]